MPRRNVTEYLQQFQRYSSDLACRYRRGYRRPACTYGNLLRGAHQMAWELQAQGLGPGDRLLLWGGACAEWLMAFWGCLMRGVVVVPLDPFATASFVQKVCHSTEARLALVGSAQSPSLPIPVVALEDLPGRLSRHGSSPFPLHPAQRQDLVQIVFTSGTTAEPKGVAISHGNILANLEPIEREVRRYLWLERPFHPIRFLHPLPLSHLFGQFMGIFVPPLLGAQVIFQDRLNPAEILQTLRRERVSVLVGVPRLLQSLRRKLEADLEKEGLLERFRKDLQAAQGEKIWRRWWRFRAIHRRLGWKFWAIISGGATLDAESEAFWNRLGFAVIQGYGLTETTSLVSINHPFRLARGSIGQVLEGHQVKLSESGEILVRGESVAAGYWQNRQLRPVAGEEGWFHTGDLGEIDEQGNLYFKGRSKEVIVTPEGLNVYPEDLEAALRCQPEVRDCAVVGVPRNGNEEACALLILRDPASRAEEVIRRVNQSLAEYQRIRHWMVWPEQDFPRTSTQKPRRPLLREVAAAHLRGEETAGSGELARLIAELTGHSPRQLSPQARLSADLGLTSIDRVQLLSQLEDRYQVELDEDRFSAATTLQELEEALRGGPSEQPLPYPYPRWAQHHMVGWLRELGYYLLLWPACVIFGYPKVVGKENWKGVGGPVLIVSNHLTALDAGLIMIALPRRIRRRLAIAMEGERLRTMRYPPSHLPRWKAWVDRLSYFLVVLLFNVFSLPQRSGFRKSFQFAGELVDQGYSLLVFPEGARSQDGKMAPFKSGIGLLVNNLKLPVMPVHLEGLFELKKAGRKMAPPGFIRVRFGRLRSFPPQSNPQQVAATLQQAVAALGESPCGS